MFAWAVQFPATEVLVKCIRQEKAFWARGFRGLLALWERTAEQKNHVVRFGVLHSGQLLPWSASGYFTLESFAFVVCDGYSFEVSMVSFHWSYVYSVQRCSELPIIVPESKTMSEWQYMLHAEVSHFMSNVWHTTRTETVCELVICCYPAAWTGTAKTCAFVLVLCEGKELAPLSIWENR